MNKIRKSLAILASVLVLTFNAPYYYVYAQDAPVAPTAPEAPSAPTSPSAPTAPESPSAPTAPDAPTAPESPTSPTAPDESETPTAPDTPEAPTAPTGPTDTESETSSETQQLTTTSNDNNTGGTESDGGMGDETITTGDATSNSSTFTNANTNTSASPSGGDSVTVDNSGNSAESNNSASVSLGDENTTTQQNSAYVVNDINQSATTGDNSANKNMGSGTITTGDANTTATVITAVNTNVNGVMVSEFNVVDDQVGDIILDFGANCVQGCDGQSLDVTNSGNGTDSQNNIDLSLQNSDATFQSNDATVENNLVLDSNSGSNEASKNMAGASIETGDANISANALTFANNNIAGDVIYAVVNIFGNLVGDIIFPDTVALDCCGQDLNIANSGNASGSDNQINVDQADVTAINQFNSADIDNNLITIANTGGNEADKNMNGGTSISTGDASITAQILNVANLNLADGDYWLVIVNEAGKWIGKILGTPDGSNVAGSSVLEFEIADNGDVSVANKGNAPDSQNTINVQSDNSTTIEQSNNAKIVNNLALTANTGDNTANKNMNGDTSITTGDANIVANIVNFVNNNIVGGGRLFVNVVNVFGSWFGDFVSPGQHKESTPLAERAGSSTQALGGATQSSNSSSSSSSSSSSDSSTDNSSGSSTEDVPVVVDPRVLAANIIRNNFAAIVGSASADNGETSGDNSSTTEVASQKVVNINLAWFILALPLILFIIVKRKKAYASLK